MEKKQIIEIIDRNIKIVMDAYEIEVPSDFIRHQIASPIADEIMILVPRATDEEIKEYASIVANTKGYTMNEIYCFERGAKWMRDKIKTNNNGNTIQKSNN